MASHRTADTPLTVAQAARELGVSPATVRRACDAGVLPCGRSPGGHRRIDPLALRDVSRADLLAGARVPLRPEGPSPSPSSRMEPIIAAAADLHDLALGTAGLLLEETGACDCDIFVRSAIGGDDVYRCTVSLQESGEDHSVLGLMLRPDVYGTTRRLMEDHEAVVVSDRGDPSLNAEDRAVYDRYGFESELGVPILSRDDLIGAIYLYSSEPRGLDRWRGYVEAVAAAAATAFERVALAKDLGDRDRMFTELLEIAGMLSQAYDVEPLLRSVANRLIWAIGAGYCDVYHRDGDRYVCDVSAGRDGYLESYEGQTFDETKNPSGMAALRAGRPLVVKNMEDGVGLTGEERVRLLGQGLRSELCIPLLAGGQPIGLLDFFDTRPRDWRDCADFLTGVGQLIAGGLQNAELLSSLERRNRELRTLVDSGLTFGSTLDAQRLLLSIASTMREATHAASVEICTARNGVLRVVAAVDEAGRPDDARAGAACLLDEMPLTRRALNGEPVIVTDMNTDRRAGDRERGRWLHVGLRSGVMVPLGGGAESAGVAVICRNDARVFDDTDLLRGLGQQAGQAIENARLYEELEQHAHLTALLNDVAAELSGTFVPEDLLGMVTARLMAVIDVQEVDAFMFEGGSIRCVAVSSREERAFDVSVGDTIPLGGWPLSRAVVANRTSVVVNDPDDPALDDQLRRMMRSDGVRSCLVSPVIVRGEVAGTVRLGETRVERRFSDEEVGFVDSVCRVAGLAIENGLLFSDLEQGRREAEFLNEIARKTAASLDLGEIVEAAVEGLHEIVGVDFCSLTLIENDEFVTAYGPDMHRAPRPVAFAGEGATRILETIRRRRVLVGDATPGMRELGGLDTAADIRSCAAIGVVDGADVVGLLMLGSRVPGAFAALNLSVLERVGMHLSLAAHNARLYQEIKELHLSNLKGLSTALNAKDYYTLGHAARVAAYLVLLGEELGWDDELIEGVRDAAYLHDIGKIGVSDRVLLKQGPLNAEEWALMRRHPIVSADIVRPLFPKDLVAAVLHHHERFDGAGYPEGLVGTEIPELARAMCVADSYDAMSLQRPYRAAFTAAECLEELDRCSGSQFDPDMVDAFKRVLTRLGRLRELARRAALEAAARVDIKAHKALLDDCDPGSDDYKTVQSALRDIRDAYPDVRFITTAAMKDDRCCIVVDAEETGSMEYSPPWQELMADDTVVEALAGREATGNVLFVDNFGVWVNSLVPLVDEDGTIIAAVDADAPALTSSGAHGYARMISDTPVSTLQEAAARLSRAEIDAITDSLTGLYNHRHLHESLREHVTRAAVEGSPLSVLFCDLDHFKNYNDQFGHAAGDAALRATARILESCTRRGDLAFRYGGEEFVVLLPGTLQTEACVIAERVLQAVEDHQRADRGTTISIGVAAFPEDAGNKESLLAAADRALYEAKRRGRDCVVAATDLDA